VGANRHTVKYYKMKPNRVHQKIYKLLKFIKNIYNQNP
jgi:hypothetical protein